MSRIICHVLDFEDELLPIVYAKLSLSASCSPITLDPVGVTVLAVSFLLCWTSSCLRGVAMGDRPPQNFRY